MENTILFGNGINLPNNESSWNGILKRLSSDNIPSQITSNTLKYEYIVMPKRETYKAPWLLNGRMFMCGKQALCGISNMENDNIKKKICQELEMKNASCLYEELAKLNANHYITTNYELFLNNVFISMGYDNEIINNPTSRLFMHNKTKKGDDSVTLWNIHGDVKTPSSVMLGFAQYCQSVVEISNILANKERDKNNWVDIFLNTNVHIVGLGLYEEEIDLWYLLVNRMREYRHTKTNKNTIYYYMVSEGNLDKDKDKKSVLEAFNIKVISVDKKGSWEDSYKEIFNIIRKSIGNRGTEDTSVT